MRRTGLYEATETATPSTAARQRECQNVECARRKSCGPVFGLGFDSPHLHQLSPHVLIQSMRTSFCIYRRINRQNMGYNYQIRAIDARSGLFGVILPDGGFHFPALFSLIIPIFRGRNQRFIKKCTLLWTIGGYRPQCEVSSTVSWNSVKCTPESGHGKSPNPYS